jgi:hypothetical protein
LQDLAVLTPSLIVCAGFLIGVVALLRHEMAPKRRNREDDRGASDKSASGTISGQEEAAPSTTSAHEEVADPPTARRSPGQTR